MIQRRSFLLLIFFSFSISQFSLALKCFAGSRGYVNGKLEQRMAEEKCDEGMIYCIESYSSNFETVTASCQRMGTSRTILNLCESGKPKTDSNELTTRCCTKDLCNNKGIEGKKMNRLAKSA